ncbi:MAG: hypothetical protein Q8M94_08035 [Ignavibacteria bacterium]|nr:hypothetical protein [Ignavibacteria bacterium]
MTDIERVRLLIGDTTSPYVFSDIKITEFLTITDNSLFGSAALALQAWASVLADSIDSENIGDYSYSRKQVDNKMALAEMYIKRERETPSSAIASFNFTNVEETE